MIEAITIANTPPYTGQPQTLTELSKFNYIYGSNGTGKTTIGRVIAKPQDYPECNVSWRAGTEPRAMVYSRDFVEKNFDQSPELKGVFTLGEEQVETVAKIEKAKTARDVLASTIANLNLELKGTDGTGGKQGELSVLRERLAEDAWKLKLRFDGKQAQIAFRRYMGSKVSFRDKVLQEEASNGSSALTIEEIEKKAESLFGPAPAPETPIQVPSTSGLLAHEVNPLLIKRILGKDDVDIAAMIRKLGNSDWVREGRAFYEANAGVCPFCQQDTTEAFAKSLSEYFDETFVADSKAIDALVTSYESDAARLQQDLSSLIATQSRFLDVAKLKDQKELLDTKVTLNNQRLVGKRKEPSRVIELESLEGVLSSITSLVDSANVQVMTHNKMVENLSSEVKTLTAQIWKFVLEDLKPDLAAYHTREGGFERAIATMTSKLSETTNELRRKDAEIRELEKQTTSVQPTIDRINALLASFGFHSFRLSKTASGKSYKLVRPDGSDAKSTLSEGERSFVTFLYFYHLLKGSESDTGVTTDRVVVFDDPVSSLDSNILFIVSTLIKRLVSDVESGSSNIKQIFVMTHNVYFHKEVTYCGNREHKKENRPTFWMVRKSGCSSKIEKCSENPVKTSYDLLWAEVRNLDPSNPSIQNTLRRILEHYFKILGGIDLDKLSERFEGTDKIICRSLVSWVHDGSHSTFEDADVSIDESMVGKYLEVFRAIFEKWEHLAHYEMMMSGGLGKDKAIAATGSTPSASA